MDTFEAVINWIVSAGTLILLSVILASWLASYHNPRTASANSHDWFFVLPTWAQIVGGLGACVLLAYLGYRLWLPLPLAVSPGAGTTFRLVGLAFFLTGWVLVLWARWALGSMYGVSTISAAPLRAQHRLIQHGPYTFIRHPMYLGYWLVLAGATLVYRTWTPLLFLLIGVPSLYWRARREESALAEQFSDEWHAYAARARFLIPFIY